MESILMFGFAAMAICFIIVMAVLGLESLWKWISWKSYSSHKLSKKEEHIKSLQRQYKSEAEIKGASFESQVRDLILYYCPGSKVKQNLIVRNGNFSKEIDLVALTPKGFILIEAKNYNHCKIVGNVREKDWMVEYNSSKKFHMYKPIFQLDSGVWNVKKKIPQIWLDKCVIFSDNCTLEDQIKKDRSVYTLSSFEHYLINLAKDGKDVYSDTFIEEISAKLDDIDTVSREEHIKNVEKIRNANA